MAIKTRKINSAYILYDDAIVENGALLNFENANAVRLSGGRGSISLLETENGRFVLRQYRRGGLIAKLIQKRYVWIGLSRSRAWLEWHLLYAMFRQSLPVPQPVAARVIRHGICYEAELITREIAGAETLADVLDGQALAASDWRAIGAVIARFHRNGIRHADLNAHNLLRDRLGRWYLIDFDRARFCRHGSWKKSNLRRLRRSLEKIVRLDEAKQFSEADWGWLYAAYKKSL